jgi:hypothetical protein
MKTIVIAATGLTLASASNYASWVVDTMSEASMLALWGGVLLIIARRAHAKRIEQPADLVAVAPRDLRTATDMRIEAGA